jgi:uncharacterized membrane protein YphA (DoxX/SURF4 family)
MQIISNIFRLKYTQFVARAIMGGTFIYASIDKIAFPSDFAKIVMNYNILPTQLAIYFSFLLPWLELFLGIFLIIGLFVRESAVLLSSLLLIFMAAMIIKSINGGVQNCGCFSISSHKIENIYFSLLRDVLLFGCGIAVIYLYKKHSTSSFQIRKNA